MTNWVGTGSWGGVPITTYSSNTAMSYHIVSSEHFHQVYEPEKQTDDDPITWLKSRVDEICSEFPLERAA